MDPLQTEPATQEYPAPEATHEQVLEDRDLFQRTLTNLLAHLGIKFKMPKVGGTEVDLHRLYQQVTSLGGLDSVTQRKQWVLACEPFKFPPSFTNKSYVVKKLYVNSLHHYEQLYFHKHQGAIVPPPIIPPMPSSTSSPKRRRACKTEPCPQVEQVVVVPDGPSSNSASTSCVFKAMEVGTRFTGTVDSVLSHGLRITFNFPGQTLQGILYRQAPSDAPPANRQRVNTPATGPATTHTDEDTAMSQELDSRHQIQSKGTVVTMRPTGPPAPPHPVQPRPPRTAYNFFQLGVNKEQLLLLHPRLASLRPQDLLPKLMAELWHQMTPDQHRPFFHMAQRDKARYDREWEEYMRLFSEYGAGLEHGRAQHDFRPPSPPLNAKRQMMHQHQHRYLAPPTEDGACLASPRQAPQYPLHDPGAVRTPPPHPEPPQAPRMCMGFPVGPPQYLPMPQALQPLKVPPTALYTPPPGACFQLPPAGSGMFASDPDLDLLPPDMEQEDIEHLCHFQQDMKSFRYDLSRDMAASFAGAGPSMGHAAVDAYPMAMGALPSPVGGAATQMGVGEGLGLFGCSTPEKGRDGPASA